MNTKKCSKCGKEFQCGNSEICWCSDFPKIMALESNSDYLCKECLVEKQNAEINNYINSNTLQQSLDFAAKHYNPDNLVENLDYTVEQGRWIVSKWFLLKRGFCCDNGCRNCPYKS